MALNIRPSTSKERKELFVEAMLNKTDKVTKVSPNSVLSGVAFGVGKIAGKAEKDIFLAVVQLFPDHAYGEQLDQVAENFGIAPRFLQSGSSTYLRLVGDVGTQYAINTHIFSGTNGIQFQLEEDVTIGTAGFTYTKVRSIDTGVQSNVNPGDVSNVTPVPVGHTYVVNEYISTGGRENESDEDFRNRIKEGANILGKATISSLEQAMMKINTNVLRVFFYGRDDNGKLVLAIQSQNGIDFNEQELDELLDKADKYMAFTELRPYGTQSFGVKLRNVEYDPLDISFRCNLFNNFDPDAVRKEIQINISKYLDFRNFTQGGIVEWYNILEIVKRTKGVKYVPDQFFYPNNDIQTSRVKIMRLRGFLMLNLEGTVISTLQNTLSPVYYPQVADFSFQQTVLAEI